MNATWRCDHSRTLKSLNPLSSPLPSYARTRTLTWCPVVSTKPKLKRYSESAEGRVWCPPRIWLLSPAPIAKDAGTPAKSCPTESLSPDPAPLEYTRDVTTSFWVAQVTRNAPNTWTWNSDSTAFSTFSVSPGGTSTSTHGGAGLAVLRSSR